MELVYTFIKERILDGTYRPSQRLTEHELCEQTGVSRNTIKKALLKLEQENLVEIETNKGAFIKAFTLEEIVNYLEIREVLEGLAIKSAAKKISEDQLNRLEEIINEMESHLKNKKFDEYSKLNKEFHEIIYESSDNAQAVEIVKLIKNQLSRYQFRTILIPERNKNSHSEHKKIFNALKARDEKKAEEAVMKHIANVRKVIMENFSILI
jgi:DNA-binding GntR family transcriptional regulator